MRNILLFISILFLSLNSFAQIDIAIIGVRAVNTASGPFNPGATISQGTALDSITFLVRNAGNTTISAGQRIDIDLTIGSGSPIALAGSLSSSLAPSASTKFFINCTSGGLNENFPTSSGNFTICILNTTTGDNNSSNDNSCTGYTMGTTSSNNYDFTVSNIRITDPTGYNPGDNIPIGTALNELFFDVNNAGTNTIPAGTVFRGELSIDGGQNSTFNVPLSTGISVGGSTSIRVNCTPGGANKSFPTTAGSFDIKVESLYTPDPNSSNNIATSTYIMGSGPQITSLSPTSGQIGSNVTIFGTNLPTTISSVQFAFGVNATVISNNSSQIVVTVPSGANTGTIRVDFGGGQVLFSPVFTITTTPVHTITSLNPTAGQIGDQIFINGTNFSTTASDHTVTFTGGAVANVMSATSTQLRVQVPTGAQSGPIEVALNGVAVSSSQSFTISTTPIHSITSLNPFGGDVGDTININGTNFATVTTDNTVRFTGGVQAAVLTAVPTRLSVVVPVGAMSGKVSVEIGGVTVTSAQDFIVVGSPLPPFITSISPTRGDVGMRVKIFGNNFDDNASGNTVRFTGSAPVTVVSASKTELTVIAPNDGMDGPISVQIGTQTATSNESFTYTSDPVISYFDPPSGPRGTTVNIYGANFDVVAANNVVYFGAISAGTPVASPDGLRLITTVPQSVGFGSSPLSVVVNGTTVIADEEFHVDVTGVEDLRSSNSLKAQYLNGSLNLYSGSNAGSGSLSTQLYNMEGKVVLSDQIKANNGTWERSYDLELPAGMYILNISGSDQNFSQKINIH